MFPRRFAHLLLFSCGLSLLACDPPESSPPPQPTATASAPTPSATVQPTSQPTATPTPTTPPSGSALAGCTGVPREGGKPPLDNPADVEPIMTLSIEGGIAGRSDWIRVWGEGGVRSGRLDETQHAAQLTNDEIASLTALAREVKPQPPGKPPGNIADGMSVTLELSVGATPVVAGSHTGGPALSPEAALLRSALEAYSAAAFDGFTLESSGRLGKPLIRIERSGGRCQYGLCRTWATIYENGWVALDERHGGGRQLEAASLAPLKDALSKLPSDLAEGYGKCCNAHVDGNDLYITLYDDTCGVARKVRVSSPDEAPPALVALAELARTLAMP